MSKKKKSSKKSSKKHFSVIVPVLIAVVVVVVFALTGNMNNKNDNNQTTDSNQAAVTQPSTNNEPQENKPDGKVTLVAVGDNLIHNTMIAAGKQSDGSYNYDKFYENTKSYIESADIAVINQETMLGGTVSAYSGYPMFNTPWEVGEAAINAGFDVFTCATNHSMDVGEKGIVSECEFFKKHPEVTHIGTYSSQDEYDTVSYVTKNGITFAMLNYTYGTNGISIPSGKSYLISVLSEDKVKKDVAQAKKNADVIIVLPHWGTENSHQIDATQKKYVQLFSDLGVDIVIGTHPHVLQPVEWVANENTGKKMLVYYSIGNFISHQVNLDQLVGGMAEITVERNNGVISITNAKLAPVVDYFHNTGSGYNFTVYKLCDYTKQIASTHSKSLSPDKAKSIARSAVSDEFLNLE